MSELAVDPNAVAEASLRLGSVAGGATDVLAGLSHHIGAATDTPAAAAVDDLLGHFSRVLPQFALAGASLSRAIGGAASDYRGTDSGVAEACESREEVPM